VLTLYSLSQCDSCRRAARWLRDRKIAFAERPIRETPPGVGELRQALAATGGQISRLCNTSGREYRAGKWAERLAGLPEAEVLPLLAANGSLIKRPLLVGDGVALVGFQETAWAAALPAR
jgi:arsenate reductase